MIWTRISKKFIDNNTNNCSHDGNNSMLCNRLCLCVPLFYFIVFGPCGVAALLTGTTSCLLCIKLYESGIINWIFREAPRSDGQPAGHHKHLALSYLVLHKHFIPYLHKPFKYNNSALSRLHFYFRNSKSWHACVGAVSQNILCSVDFVHSYSHHIFIIHDWLKVYCAFGLIELTLCWIQLKSFPDV